VTQRVTPFSQAIRDLPADSDYTAAVILAEFYLKWSRDDDEHSRNMLKDEMEHQRKMHEIELEKKNQYEIELLKTKMTAEREARQAEYAHRERMAAIQVQRWAQGPIPPYTNQR
jgi:hypothetical protein